MKLGGENEVYETRPWVVRRLLEHPLARPMLQSADRYLEPMAGSGQIIRAASKFIEENAGPTTRTSPTWTAVEYREECGPMLMQAGSLDVFTGSDFFKWAKVHHRTFDAVVANPAFSLADDCLLACRRLAPSGWLAFLLRLDFLAGGGKRDPLFEKLGQPDVLVIPDRVSFDVPRASAMAQAHLFGAGAPDTGTRPSGGTDMFDYAWMIWPPGPPRTAGRVARAARTPRSERASSA